MALNSLSVLMCC